jgi:hypothetical protein
LFSACFAWRFLRLLRKKEIWCDFFKCFNYYFLI